MPFDVYPVNNGSSKIVGNTYNHAILVMRILYTTLLKIKRYFHKILMTFPGHEGGTISLALKWWQLTLSFLFFIQVIHFKITDLILKTV